MSHSRRKFFQLVSGGALASAAPLHSVAQQNIGAMKAAPSDRVRVALTGVNGVGFDDLTSHIKLPDVQCVALCDLDQNILQKRAAEVNKLTGSTPALFTDFRKLHEQKDIDAVIIATPDHWHTLATINACQAGKHVYVEKPIACTFDECDAMVGAVEKYKRVVQVGQQQRSGAHWQEVVRQVQSGKLGKIRTVKTWVNVGWRGELPPVPDTQPPAGVDYTMWLGPAPKRPFNPVRFHNTWRFFWDYAGGYMTDWGVHLIDIALWAMNVKGPDSVMSSGGKFAYPTDARQTPDTQIATYQFSDFLLTWEHTIGTSLGPYGKDHGIAFYGANGTIVANRNGWELVAEKNDAKSTNPFKTEAVAYRAATTDDRYEHAKNFIATIKGKEKLNCDIHTGRIVALNAQIGNIAYRHMNGIQVGGIFNYAKRLRGVQIGLINIADTSEGYSIGLLNIILKGYHKLALTSNELMNVNASFKTGNKKLYSILMAGYNYGNDAKIYSFGYGIGNEIKLNNLLSINPELSAQYLYRGNIFDLNLLGKFNLDLHLNFGKHFSIFGGPSFNAYYTDQQIAVPGYKSVLPKEGFKTFKLTSQTEGWIGWNIGVSFF